MNKSVRYARHDEVPPLINAESDTLLLGSMLSPKSADAKFYYAHPQNRFWRVIAAVFGEPYTVDNSERAQMAISHRLALWDVLNSCEIIGASDSTIKNVTYNDIDGLLKANPKITRIFTTGGAAHRFLKAYNKTISNKIVSEATVLPSTSPLNCKMSLNELISAYSVLL